MTPKQISIRYESPYLAEAFIKEVIDMGYNPIKYNPVSLNEWQVIALQKTGKKAFITPCLIGSAVDDNSNKVFYLEKDGWDVCVEEARELLRPTTPIEGEWWYLGGMIVFVEEFIKFGDYGVIGYGINTNSKWRPSGTRFGVWKYNENRPATADEVEKTLIAEAEKRGFKIGANIDNTNLGFGINLRIYSNCKFELNKDNNWFLLNGWIIFKDGEWANVTEPKEPTKFFDWEVEKINEDIVKIGCGNYTYDYLNQVRKSLRYFHGATTVQDIKEELVKILGEE